MKKILVIPVLNEEKHIEYVVRRGKKYIKDIIIVDDGSIDNSAEKSREAGARVIRLEKNTGKANALKEGFKSVNGYDIVVMMDGDLQHSPAEIDTLVEKVENGYDLCIGSRFLSDSSSMPRVSKFSNKVASILISLLAGVRITDPQSGFRAIRVECLKNLELKANRYSIEHIMILECSRKKYKITEAPISTIYGEEKSYVRPISDTYLVAKDIIKFLLRY